MSMLQMTRLCRVLSPELTVGELLLTFESQLMNFPGTVQDTYQTQMMKPTICQAG